MKAFLIATVVAIALAYVASFVLSERQVPSYAAYSTDGARVSNPGDNLVGTDWPDAAATAAAAAEES